jgi:hypothetical protein
MDEHKSEAFHFQGLVDKMETAKAKNNCTS